VAAARKKFACFRDGYGRRDSPFWLESLTGFADSVGRFSNSRMGCGGRRVHDALLDLTWLIAGKKSGTGAGRSGISGSLEGARVVGVAARNLPLASRRLPMASCSESQYSSTPLIKSRRSRGVMAFPFSGWARCAVIAISEIFSKPDSRRCVAAGSVLPIVVAPDICYLG